MPRMYCSHVAYCTTLDVQTLTTSRLPRDPISQRWNYVGEKWPMNFAWNDRHPRSIQKSFTCRKSTTWDRRLYLPSEGRRAEDFFALKNPTASAGFEPANMGTKGQHATSRPPKLLLGNLLKKQVTYPLYHGPPSRSNRLQHILNAQIFLQPQPVNDSEDIHCQI